MNSLESVFLNTISREKMFPRDSVVYAAVSGGADSVAMTHLLARFAVARGWTVRVLHINHQLRHDADEDEQFVKNLARELSLPFTSISPEAASGGSMESRWSTVRHRIFQNLPGLVAVAHNAGDRAETVLLRLVEGSGLRGLGGMDYCGRGSVRRPMLDMDRDCIRSWLQVEGLSWREDESNTDPAMARNRMRMNVLPVLKENFPEAVSGICRAGGILSLWRDLQDQLSELFTEDSMERVLFSDLPEVVSSLALWQLAGRPRKGFEEFSKVAVWLKGGGNGSHILPGGKKLIADRESIRIVEKGSGRY